MIKGKLNDVLHSEYALSEYQRTQESLRRSEKKYRDLVETSQDLIWSVDINGCFTFVNRKAAMSIYGYEPEEMLGRHFTEFESKAQAKKDLDVFEYIKKNVEEGFRSETVHKRKDGSLVYLSYNAMVVRDEYGDVIGVTGTASDITILKQKEKENLLSLRRFKRYQKTILRMATHESIINGNIVPAAGFICKEAAHALEVERVSIWMLNENQHELRCVSLYRNADNDFSSGEILKYDSYPNYFKALTSGRAIDAQDALKDPRTREFSDVYLKPYGISSMLDSAIRVSGKVVGVICHEHVGDIRNWHPDEVTFAGDMADQFAQALLNQQKNDAMKELEKHKSRLERLVDKRTKTLKKTNIKLRQESKDLKRTEEYLRQANMFLDSIIENIPDMIFLKDAEDLKFVRFNKAGENLLGFSRDQLLGKNDYDFFPKEEADAFTAKDREVLNNQDVYDIAEEPIHTKYKGTRYLHTKKIPLVDGNGNPKYLLGISEDITERKVAEHKEKELQAKLIQADKLSSIGLLAAGIAHELNNPLTGLLSLLRLYRKKKEYDDEEYKDLTDMLEASDRMAKIVEDLNCFSRVSEGEKIELNLNYVIDSIFSFSSYQFVKNNIKIVKKYEENLGRMIGNKSQIQQVVLNLLTNACDAMEQGGILTIQTLNDKAANEVILKIIDTGMGIKEEHYPKIFDPFFTTKPLGQGTGLGLSVLHGIVKSHNGNVTFKSQVGRGTIFTVKFPMHR